MMENEVLGNKMNSYTDLTDERDGNAAFYHAPNNGIANDNDQHHNNDHLTRHEMSDADAEKLRMAAQLSREVQPGNGNDQEQESVHTTSSGYPHHRTQEYASQEHYDKHMMSQHQMQHMAEHSIPQYGAQIVPYSTHDAPAQFTPVPEDDDTPARKKKKTSRACDECRRKKVKCDADGDIEGSVCSNCKRSSGRCLFTRQPLKRGPSKGYIKDLSDRLDAVESVVIPDQIGERATSSGYTGPSAHVQAGLKRKRDQPSMINNLAGFQAPPTVSFAEQGDEPLMANENHSQHTSGSLAPRTEWTRTSEQSLPNEHYADELLVVKLNLNKESFQRYYNAIHPILPFLPHSKVVLAAQLDSTTPELQEAFVAALKGEPRQAWLLLSVELDETHGFTRAENLLALQILLLIAIDASNSGPEGSQLAKRALATAAATAYDVSLHINMCDESMLGMSDEDTDELMARRIWWSLVILDRFTASNTGSPKLIDGNNAMMLPAEKRVIGQDLYSMSEIARVLGQVTTFNAVQKPNNGHHEDAIAAIASVYRNSLYSGIEAVQINISDRDPRGQYVPAMILTLACWYAQALLGETDTMDESMRAYQAAHGMFAILTNQNYRTSPLDYLFKLCIARIFVAVHGALPEMDEKLEILRSMCISSTGWNTQIREEIAKVMPEKAVNTDHGPGDHGLQHLAELATAENGSGHRNSNEYDERADTGLSRALQEASQNAEREAQEAARESYNDHGVV